MSTETLKGRKIAVLFTDGFEESEYTGPRKALDEAGAEVHVIAPEKRQTKSWKGADWSAPYDVDKSLDEVNAKDYDALLLPGGVLNPDQLRKNEKAVAFITDIFQQSKPIAAICHGPQVLTETRQLEGITMTSYPSVRTDLINAGVDWVDQEVVVDKGIVTSRNPDDIPAFSKKMVEEFAQRSAPDRKVA